MPRPRKDGTPATVTPKLEESPDITVIKHLEIAYRFADGYLGSNPDGPLAAHMLYACMSISETITTMRPTIRQWYKNAISDRQAYEEYVEAIEAAKNEPQSLKVQPA